MARLKIAVKFFVAVSSIVGLVAAGLLFLQDSTFKVRNIEVALDEEASHVFLFPKIKEGLEEKLQTLYGQYIWKVDLEKVLATVEKDLRIKDAKIARVLPNTLQVQISPYTPVANVTTHKA